MIHSQAFEVRKLEEKVDELEDENQSLKKQLDAAKQACVNPKFREALLTKYGQQLGILTHKEVTENLSKKKVKGLDRALSSDFLDRQVAEDEQEGTGANEEFVDFMKAVVSEQPEEQVQESKLHFDAEGNVIVKDIVEEMRHKADEESGGVEAALDAGAFRHFAARRTEKIKNLEKAVEVLEEGKFKRSATQKPNEEEYDDESDSDSSYDSQVEH